MLNKESPCGPAGPTFTYILRHVQQSMKDSWTRAESVLSVLIVIPREYDIVRVEVRI